MRQLSELAEITLALRQPFPASEILFRPGQNTDLAYIDVRLVYDRLTSVVGLFGWSLETSTENIHTKVVRYEERSDGTKLKIEEIVPSTVFRAKIGIALPDGTWVYKDNFADEANQDAIKGGASDAVKRAAVPWGIGAYLYRLKGLKGGVYDKTAKKYTTSPVLPDWALPVDEVLWARALNVELFGKTYGEIINSVDSLQEFNGAVAALCTGKEVSPGQKKAYEHLTKYWWQKFLY